ncbi:unnamed protein product [Protopolystoma xenopodis]|uniref:G-protein coupled receptors family 1 profile domain-containing protein n=1 Tax=Protopolystoma xenopodis TaxID=117903 RepID=A0A448WRC5_9PLAT|nr:unnamed protein product [Protopolystoma xenopodis]
MLNPLHQRWHSSTGSRLHLYSTETASVCDRWQPTARPSRPVVGAWCLGRPRHRHQSAPDPPSPIPQLRRRQAAGSRSHVEAKRMLWLLGADRPMVRWQDETKRQNSDSSDDGSKSMQDPMSVACATPDTVVSCYHGSSNVVGMARGVRVNGPTSPRVRTPRDEMHPRKHCVLMPVGGGWTSGSSSKLVEPDASRRQVELPAAVFSRQICISSPEDVRFESEMRHRQMEPERSRLEEDVRETGCQSWPEGKLVRFSGRREAPKACEGKRGACDPIEQSVKSDEAIERSSREEGRLGIGGKVLTKCSGVCGCWWQRKQNRGTMAVTYGEASGRVVAAPPSRREQRNERKAARTLSAILVAFIVTWTPYNVFAVINGLLSETKPIPDSVYNVGKPMSTCLVVLFGKDETVQQPKKWSP